VLAAWRQASDVIIRADMAIVKGIKTAIRKWIFQPLGYDLVPLQRKQKVSKNSVVKNAPASDGGNYHLDQYVELFGEAAVREKRFYNLGAEPRFVHPAWTVINHPSAHYGSDYMHIQWDLLSGDPLPIEDDQAKVIFSRYTLEHVTDKAADHFFREAYRALAIGGYLRIIVPDTDIFYQAYLARMPGLFHRPHQDTEEFPNEKYLSNPNRASFEQRFLWTFASNATELHPDGAPERISDNEFQKAFRDFKYEEALDYCTAKCSLDVQKRYPENHINWFTGDKLTKMIHDAGFDSVYRSGFGRSLCPILRDVQLLEARRPEIGLYVEAMK
jgi:predicted SAM-dependent methyltransferase